ncbi:MAG: LruC domain-containing protein [Schleiferiaceae bacterium]|nr:LruC domain-containing protein [Schleiferiaceae bacterium]
MKSGKVFLIGILCCSLFVGCNKDKDENNKENPSLVTSFTEMNVPSSFQYKTSSEEQFGVRALDNIGNPIQGVVCQLFTANPEDGGSLVAKGITSSNGIVNFDVLLGHHVDKLWLQTDYIGLPIGRALAKHELQGIITIGGAQSNKMQPSELFGSRVSKTAVANLYTMGTWDNQGVPNYLEPNLDPIDAAFLAELNNTLPEQQDVRIHSPQLLSTGDQSNTHIIEPADVWLTFVHEGAGYRNVLGFYSYPTNNPPASVADIDSMKIIFPNASYPYSGGNLPSGSKVYLGQFSPGTSIGYFIVADGFNPNDASIRSNREIFYSNPNFNPESDPNLRQHMVMLRDVGRNKIILGFEDIKRDRNTCDHDFNDVLFYVSANPISAISASDLPTVVTTAKDTDGDGVPDAFDDFPNDANRAFVSYYPSENGYASVAFEDLWPGKGDYDFNDMVVDFRIKKITNADNRIVDLETETVVAAIGAHFKNGFGFVYNVAPSNVASVTGFRHTEGIINLNSNGTETGQLKTVVIATDNAYNVLRHSGSGVGVNVNPGASFSVPDTLTIQVSFINAVSNGDLGAAPYNPFIFINGQRGREVHLVDQEPTNLADFTLFGTNSDYSIPGENKFYRTNDNLPWAIALPERFMYPYEKVDLVTAYPNLPEWAQSGGGAVPNWFQDAPGNRNNAVIFPR